MRQQGCKMQIPPYSPTQRCKPQFRLPHRATAPKFRLPTERRRQPTRGSSAYIPEAMPPLWLPASRSLPKWEKTCPDSSQTHMQNFTPLSFSATEKFVTVHTKKQTRKTYSKLNTRHTTIWWDNTGKDWTYTSSRQSTQTPALNSRMYSRK